MNDRNNLINFDPKAHILEKARAYIEDLPRFLEERERAVPILLRALKMADRRFKHRIILLLGGFAKREIVGPLYEIMKNPLEDEGVRHDASIQLAVTLPFLNDAQSLIDALLADLKSEDPELRANAAFALGWEGNVQAGIPLIELLYDPEVPVQQSAVNALANLRDDRILKLLLERLAHGPQEQKRAILYNLWRFYSKREAVIDVYQKYLETEDDELRFDALILLASMVEPAEFLDLYRNCLQDRNPRIREQVLSELEELGPSRLASLEDEIRPLLKDAEPKVRQAAIKLLKKIDRPPSTP
jgi:HEAT repeat protein